MRKVKILSDYTPADKANHLILIRDNQGDVHISMVQNDRSSPGIRIAADGTRHSGKVRRAFYALND